MLTFLEKLAQFPPVREVLLVSRTGEPMYMRIAGNEERVRDKIDILTGLLRDFEFPRFAEIYFEKGLYFYVDVAFGHIIVGLHDKSGLEKVRKACLSVQAKLDSSAACRNILVKMTNDVPQNQRAVVIRALQPYADRETASLLLPILKDAEQYITSGGIDVVVAAVQLLGNTASRAALQQLKALSQLGNDRGSEELRQKVQVATRQLELDLDGPVRAESLPVSVKAPIVERQQGGAGTASPIEAGGSPEEKQLAALLQNNDRKAAVAMAMQQIENLVLKKKFKEAEQWRDKLIFIDSMAIQEIVKSAEMIDEARATVISGEYIAIWKQLAKAVSREEFTALYHAMDHMDISHGEYIVSQGNFKPNLYFVNSGKVQLSARNQGRVIPLKIVDAGEIFGAEHFFESSVWTIDAVSLGSEISVLPMASLRALKDSCPSLYSKLFEFCAKIPSVNAVFSRTAKNRRKYQRLKAQGRVTIEFLQEGVQELGTGVKGELIDISQGGVSFALHFSRKKYALALLSQDIEMTIRPMNMQSSLVKKGQIMAIRSYGFVGNEFSIHVEFDEAVSLTDMDKFTVD